MQHADGLRLLPRGATISDGRVGNSLMPSYEERTVAALAKSCSVVTTTVARPGGCRGFQPWFRVFDRQCAFRRYAKSNKRAQLHLEVELQLAYVVAGYDHLEDSVTEQLG